MWPRLQRMVVPLSVLVAAGEPVRVVDQEVTTIHSHWAGEEDSGETRLLARRRGHTALMSNGGVAAVPPRLRQLAEAWTSAGKPPQSGIGWRLKSWQAAFPKHEKLFKALPNPLDRAAVTVLAQAADVDKDAAEAAFVAAMVWGYGNVGYGPFRTARVLAENRAATGTLRDVAAVLRSDGGPDAFAWLRKNRLTWLGVAFATKYLYFCSVPSQPAPALVLDRLVQRWLQEHAEMWVRLDWRVADYRNYVEAAVGWADALAIGPADVEYLMFADAAASSTGSQWSTPAFISAIGDVDHLAGRALPAEGVALLEILDEAGEAFAALPDGAHDGGPDAAAEFDRGLRHLRQLVLARLV